MTLWGCGTLQIKCENCFVALLDIMWWHWTHTHTVTQSFHSKCTANRRVCKGNLRHGSFHSRGPMTIPREGTTCMDKHDPMDKQNHAQSQGKYALALQVNMVAVCGHGGGRCDWEQVKGVSLALVMVLFWRGQWGHWWVYLGLVSRGCAYYLHI